MSNLEKFIENPTSSEYVTELNRLNYKFRRMTAFKILESTEKVFSIEIFGEIFTIDHSRYDLLPPTSIANQVMHLVIQAYQNFVYRERLLKIHPSVRKMPKTIVFKGKNLKLAEIRRIIEIQIGKNIPLFRKACKYFGLKCTFWNIYQLSTLPEAIFEMEPAYVLALIKIKEITSDLEIPISKQELYKLINSHFDKKEVVKVLPKLSCTVARRFIAYACFDDPFNLKCRKKFTNMHDICKFLEGSPTFNLHVINMVGLNLTNIEDVIHIAAAYSKKRGKSKYTVQKFDEIRDWLIQTGTKLDKNQKKRGLNIWLKSLMSGMRKC